ncbi:MAG: peptidoglycan recognition protein family protein [Nanoarchaeota archaeon]|nr:peptidoglycan recognition protein family protein [Nanoarchaeota archaeon]
MEIERKVEVSKVGLLRENNPEWIILHSTIKHQTLDSIYRLHVNKLKWNGIGYHFFISGPGKVYQTRPLDKEGAHALGFNFNSIGICIPENEDLNLNLKKTKKLVEKVNEEFGNLPVMSHTLAQVKYLNKLFKFKELNYHFFEETEYVNREKYLQTKNEYRKIADKLTPKDKYLKIMLNAFKNCPGEKFEYFLKEINEKELETA